MSEKLRVDGMHCDACVALVKMELEEVGIDEDQISVRVEGLNNSGEVTLHDVNDQQKEKAIEAINSLDSYQVI